MLGGSRRVSMAQLLKESGKRLGCEVEIVAYELDTQVPIAIEGDVIRAQQGAGKLAIGNLRSYEGTQDQ